MRPAYAFHSAHRSLSFFLCPSLFSLSFFSCDGRSRRGKMVAAPDKLFVFLQPFLPLPSPLSSLPLSAPFLQWNQLWIVLGCIRKANVIIHARILRVPLHHVWETCCATRHVVGGSCKLLLYSVCHFYDTGIKFLLYFLYYLYSSCALILIFMIFERRSLIMLSYKFIPRISKKRTYI